MSVWVGLCSPFELGLLIKANWPLALDRTFFTPQLLGKHLLGLILSGAIISPIPPSWGLDGSLENTSSGLLNKTRFEMTLEFLILIFFHDVTKTREKDIIHLVYGANCSVHN